ncbi:hypothetical protein ACHWQZ_G019424 [Mnemiopsis leidyi]
MSDATDNLMETDLLNQKGKTRWTTLDQILLVFLVLVSLGDGVEIYSPGALTQYIACDIGINGSQEGFLACALYLTMGIATIIAGPVSNVICRRKIVLLSLYGCAVSTILGAAVGTYTTLIIYRALMGLSVGMNMSVAMVLVSEMVSSVDVKEPANDGSLNNLLDTEEANESNLAEAPNFKSRLVKVCLFCVLNNYQGWGTVLLLPALIKNVNDAHHVGENKNCETVTKGSDFLLLAFAIGASGAGRIICKLVRRKFTFRFFYSTLTGLTIVSYVTLMLKKDTMFVVVATSFVCKFVFGAVFMEQIFIIFDAKYFGMRMALGCAVVQGLGATTVLFGTSLVSFTSTDVAIIAGLAASVIQMVVVNTMWEQDSIIRVEKYELTGAVDRET